MKRCGKTIGLLAIATSLLVPLGITKSTIKAEEKSEARLESNLIEMVSKSERVTKYNIKKLITLENGLSLFRFQYKTDPITTYVGLMADDVVKHKKFRDYVIHMGEGSYMIHYEKLGLHPVTLKKWQDEGMKALRLSKDLAATKQK